MESNAALERDLGKLLDRVDDPVRKRGRRSNQGDGVTVNGLACSLDVGPEIVSDRNFD